MWLLLTCPDQYKSLSALRHLAHLMDEIQLLEKVQELVM
jgi:hypothetical protein